MSRKFRFTGECFDSLKDLYAQISGKKGKKILIEDPTPLKPAQGEPKEEASQAVKTPEGKKEPVNPLEATEGKTLTLSRTNIGKVRTSNQDAVIDSWPLLGVADGMGGHQGGEVASASTRDLLTQQLKGKTPEAVLLRNAITAVNRRLFIRQQEEKELSGMGTTLTVMWVGKENILLGHVGDSRAYRFRDGALEQITSDHSMVAEMVREGVLTPEQAACHPMRNVITRAVGTEEGIDADILTEERKKGDVWLICSDGLHGMVSGDQMTEILHTNPPEAAADLLVEAALEAGGRDNISLTIFVDGEDPA